jgi:hypothetical protein
MKINLYITGDVLFDHQFYAILNAKLTRIVWGNNKYHNQNSSYSAEILELFT